VQRRIEVVRLYNAIATYTMDNELATNANLPPQSTAGPCEVQIRSRYARNLEQTKPPKSTVWVGGSTAKVCFGRRIS